MSEIKLDSFPSNRYEALTMLYLQHQDLSGISPTELAQKYESVLAEIREHFSRDVTQQVRL